MKVDNDKNDHDHNKQSSKDNSEILKVSTEFEPNDHHLDIKQQEEEESFSKPQSITKIKKLNIDDINISFDNKTNKIQNTLKSINSKKKIRLDDYLVNDNNQQTYSNRNISHNENFDKEKHNAAIISALKGKSSNKSKKEKNIAFSPYTELEKLVTNPDQEINKIRSSKTFNKIDEDSSSKRSSYKLKIESPNDLIAAVNKKENGIEEVSNKNENESDFNLSFQTEDELNYQVKNEEIPNKFNKHKLQIRVEHEFNQLFMIETSIELKEGLFFKKYHMILKKNILILIKEEAKLEQNMDIKLKTPHLVFDFDFLTAACFVNSKNLTFIIKIIGTKKEFKFRLFQKNKELFIKVSQYLNYFIKQSKGNKEVMFNIVLRGDLFYKYFFLNEIDLTNSAKTGDILLFKGSEIASRCQRMLTCEDYGKLNNKLYIIRSCCLTVKEKQ